MMLESVDFEKKFRENEQDWLEFLLWNLTLCYFEVFGIFVTFNGGIFALGELNLYIFHQMFALFFSSGRVIMADFSLKKDLWNEN